MVTLESDRLILRNYKDSDLTEYHKILSDKENMYYIIPFGIVTNSIEESHESLRNAIEYNTQQKGYRFCIALKENDKMIGGIGYGIAAETPVGKIADPMGWFLAHEHQNKGYITEAAKKLLEYAFLQDNCVRVVTACFKENIPTQKVMAKLGFRKESEKLNAMWHDGEMRDRLEYAINRDEFNGAQPQWCNVLLTDSGFYYDNELDKPLDLLINRSAVMLGKPFEEARVLFIPTAAMENEEKATAITERLKNELIVMGFLDSNITIHDIDGSLAEEDALKFDVIYLTGGRTPYLAKRVREVGFEKIIKRMIFANKVYIGMSAGSMLLMHHFNEDDMYNPDFAGLGLVKAYAAAHCPAGTENRIDLPLPHIALQENQAIEACWNGYTLLEGNLQYE